MIVYEEIYVLGRVIRAGPGMYDIKSEAGKNPSILGVYRDVFIMA